MCAGADPVNYEEKGLLASIPFKVVAENTTQIKVSVKVTDMFADEEASITFPSSNLVSGKVTVGVDKTALKEKIDYINGLDESDYTAVSYQNAVTAAKNATAVYESVTSTQDTVDAQVELLEQAIAALEETQGDGNYFYFRNTLNWDEVYAYWWGSADECPAFPGIKATQVAGRDGVYYVELPEDATGLNFNNGVQASDGGQQTDSITGDSLTIGNIFVPDPDDFYEKNGGLRFRGVSEKYVPNIFYFRNNLNWDEVYAYWWGSADECPAFPRVFRQPQLREQQIFTRYSSPRTQQVLTLTTAYRLLTAVSRPTALRATALYWAMYSSPIPMIHTKRTADYALEAYLKSTFQTPFTSKMLQAGTTYMFTGGAAQQSACRSPEFSPKNLREQMIFTTQLYAALDCFNFSSGKPGNEGGEQTSSITTFNPGQILIIDLDSAYIKDGGIRYDASYDVLEKYTTGIDVLMGDANNDGVVDISDATLIQKYSSSYTELDDTQLFAGDVDGDGNIDVADVTLIQKYSASIETDTNIGTYAKYIAS